MNGIYSITVSNALVKYDFTLRQNITIVRGDSATGKTTLVQMIDEYSRYGTQSGIQLICEKECRRISGRDWQLLIKVTKDSIIFIDEDDFIRSAEFAECISKTDNYYVLFTRERLPAIPYSMDEIYGIRSSGKYGRPEPVIHEFFRLPSPFDFSSGFETQCR